MSEPTSEFGAGVVVCLAKFSEHLWGRQEERISDLLRAKKHGDVSDQAQRDIDFYVSFHADHPEYARGHEPIDWAIHQAIWMWMNAAGDHMFDLDREKAPPELCALADAAIRLRNDWGPNGKSQFFTEADYAAIRPLWQAACLALDRQIGTDPDWGEW